MLERVSRYVREVRNETRKVTWPTRRQILSFTGVVLAMVVTVALFMAGINAVLNWALTAIVGTA